MSEFLSHALHPVILIYVVSGMLALGLGQTVSQILAPLRNVRTTVSALVASYLLLPLLAAVTARLFGLDPELRYGLVLMAMAAGAEVGPVLAGISGANVRLAGGLLVLSIAITIVYLPLMIGVFLPDADVPVGPLALKLSLTILAPLCVGLLVKSRFDRFAHGVEHWMHLASRIFVILLTVDVLLLYYKPIIALLGSYAILAALISVLGGFGIGYLLGGSTPGDRLAMGYMHGARSASIAVMVAADVFREQPKVMLMVAVVTLFILGILIPASFFLKLKPAAAAGVPQAPAA